MHGDYDVAEFADGEQRHAVFVCVYKMVEPPQRIGGTSVRLRLLNLVNHEC
jgi:hypothetical protein